VTGSLGVGRLPGGAFDVSDRLFQFRDYRMAGESSELSDSRLSGHLMSDWNWDVHASGSLPIPAWGTMTIETTEGSWDGAFTGIRRADGEPVAIRALLFGTGPYEGLCATLDITATSILVPNTWTIDGIIHPAPMTAAGA
jgi:hypothetical protein